MAKEKLQLTPTDAAEVGFKLLTNPEIGYFSRSSLEKALLEHHCDPSRIKDLAKAVIQNANQQYQEEHSGNPNLIPRGNYVGRIKLERTTFVPQIEPAGESSRKREVKRNEVTLYFNPAVVKEHTTHERYEEALRQQEEATAAKEAQDKADREAERKALQDEKTRALEAAKRPSSVAIVLTTYRKEASPLELAITYQMVEEDAEDRTSSWLDNITDEYPDPFARVIDRDLAVNILNNGITEAELKLVAATVRQRLVNEIRQMQIDGEKMAEKIFEGITDLSTTRRGRKFFTPTFIQRGYLPMIYDSLVRLTQGNEHIEKIVSWDNFAGRPNAMFLGFAWHARYEDATYAVYEQNLREKASTAEWNADTLLPLLSNPTKREALRNGQSIISTDGSHELTPEDVDTLFADFLLNDRVIIQAIMADLIRIGFLTTEYDDGILGEEATINIRFLLSKVTYEEIIDALSNKPIDTSDLEKQIEAIKKEVSNLQKQAHGNKRSRQAIKATQLQNKLPPLSHQLKALQQSNLHPVYAGIQRLILEKTPSIEPQEKDYPVDPIKGGRPAYTIDSNLYTLRGDLKPNYLDK